ncbi:replication-relaxation family protein [Bacillus seohaeanensis]|uniref:Replication-relaxation family protein n=1 Tax=Bacillus seohaeanensis TaxID=284580 RepID=A0ABW5RPU1_9BACI
MHRLGKVRNTNRILKDLSPYLSSFREDYSTIYYLNSEGREYVNSKKVRKKTNFINHVLMRNYFYIFAGMPMDWQNEIKVYDNEFSVVCDTYFKSRGRYHFLEVDLSQKMIENRKKMKQYIGLYKNESVKESLGYFPQLIWVTTTEYRRKQLEELCKDIPSVVYTLTDIK